MKKETLKKIIMVCSENEFSDEELQEFAQLVQHVSQNTMLPINLEAKSLWEMLAFESDEAFMSWTNKMTKEMDAKINKDLPILPQMVQIMEDACINPIYKRLISLAVAGEMYMKSKQDHIANLLRQII